MNPAIATELRKWEGAFKEELLAQLASLREDKDVYGFALNLPEDLADPDVAAAVGRKSKLADAGFNPLSWMTRKYCPVEWECLPNADSFHQTCDGLERISRDHQAAFIDPSSEYTDEGREYRDSLYAACLKVMEQCDLAGAFGHIKFNVLFLSDDSHPIVREAFDRLNSGRSLWWRWGVWPFVK